VELYACQWRVDPSATVSGEQGLDARDRKSRTGGNVSRLLDDDNRDDFSQTTEDKYLWNFLAWHLQAVSIIMFPLFPIASNEVSTSLNFSHFSTSFQISCIRASADHAKTVS
jgi:hypothetical protein